MPYEKNFVIRSSLRVLNIGFRLNEIYANWKNNEMIIMHVGCSRTYNVNMKSSHDRSQRPYLLGCFNSKTRTSLKTKLLFYVFRAFQFSRLFPPRKLLTDRQRTVCILAFPSFVNVLILHLLPFSTSYFCSAAFKSILFRLSISE